MSESVVYGPGGVIPGGDEATWFPALWKWLVREFEVKSVLDVGCGEGHALRFFQSLGVTAVGVDLVPQDDSRIMNHDFTQGPWYSGMDFDLVWSCEFLEHVEERYVGNLLEAFKRSNLVAITHAFPGQGGFHHVNCRDPEYWRGAFASIGLIEDVGLTQRCKALSRANVSPWNHFLRSGLVLRRT